MAPAIALAEQRAGDASNENATHQQKAQHHEANARAKQKQKLEQKQKQKNARKTISGRARVEREKAAKVLEQPNKTKSKHLRAKQQAVENGVDQEQQHDRATNEDSNSASDKLASQQIIQLDDQHEQRKHNSTTSSSQPAGVVTRGPSEEIQSTKGQSKRASELKLQSELAIPLLTTGRRPAEFVVGSKASLETLQNKTSGAKSDSTSAGWLDNNLNRHILITGVFPTLACAILAMIICLILRLACNKRQEKRERKHLAKLKNRAFTIGASPIKGFLGSNVIATNEKVSNSKLAMDDAKKLTLNIEDNVSTRSNNSSCVDDSDESGKRRQDKKLVSASDRKLAQVGKARSIYVNPITKLKRSATVQPKRNKLTKQALNVSEDFGRLKYKLNYDFQLSQLVVDILEAENLPAMDSNGLSDPYVKVYLIPSEKQIEKTRVHKRTLNPKFNETFKFQEIYQDLLNKTLTLEVYDFNRFSKHEQIGQISIPMGSIDLAQIDTERWTSLKQIDSGDCGPGGAGSELGNICISLRYVQTAGRLNVIILEARKLKKMDLGGLSDPYVKLSLISEGKRIKKKKTTIKKCTLNPQYNEAFSFDIPFAQINAVQLVITVVDYDRIGTSEPIGKVVLGTENTSGETEKKHWMDMLASPRRAIAQWHTLKCIDSDNNMAN